jgi:hypothetical protein
MVVNAAGGRGVLWRSGYEAFEGACTMFDTDTCGVGV